jgi:hypothetical protein
LGEGHGAQFNLHVTPQGGSSKTASVELRWTVEKMDPEECRKMTWLDPPNERVRSTLQAGATRRRWMFEMPCVFAALAQAIDRHLKGLGNPWPPDQSLQR